VKRALAWLAGIVGVAALGRLLSRRKGSATQAAEPPASTEIPADDPAEELRRKLAAKREPEAEVGEVAAEPAEVDETLEGRRARVHAQAREAIEAMHEDGPAA
jgi:hypothetical protein